MCCSYGRSYGYDWHNNIITMQLSKVLFADVSVSVPTMLSVGEGEEMVEVCVTLFTANSTDNNITVTLDTEDGTGM